MTRLISRYARGKPGGSNININGRVLNVDLARIVYKCEICYGDLLRHNMGLRCKTDPAHRGFIHRDEIEKIRAAQAENVSSLPYEIKDGKVIVKGQKDNGD